MSGKKPSKQQPNRSDKGRAEADARAARQAEQLRANLTKRKQQQRSRTGGKNAGES